MALTPEGKVKAKVKALLKKHHVYYFMPATGGYGRSGIPDFVCCALSAKSGHGHFIAIECKAIGGIVTALQHRELENIRSQGGVALVIDDHNLDWLDGFLNGLTSSKE